MIQIATRAQVEFSSSLAARLKERRYDRECAAWADRIADALDNLPHGIIVPIGEFVREDEVATVVAHHAAELIAEALRRRWRLDGLKAEYGELQKTVVEEGCQSRTLLPHHDGGNSSYLTPSLLDVADWQVENRRTLPNTISTTRMHKLYQGFLVRSVGEKASLTPYYDLLRLLLLAKRYSSGRAEIPVAVLQTSLAVNLTRAVQKLREWGGGYIQLGAMLGARDPKHFLVNLHNIDLPFSSRELLTFPDLAGRISNGKSPVQQLFEQMIEATIGIEWSTVRTLTEVCIRSNRNDLVLGHNIFLMHGGLWGGRSRVLDPVCISLPFAGGEAYERWLSIGWKTGYKRAIGRAWRSRNCEARATQ